MRQVVRLNLCFVVTAVVAASPLYICPPAGALPFRSCDQAEAAGAAPIFAGQPGYSLDLDADGDGVACEQGSGARPPVITGSPVIPSAAGRYTTTIAWGDSPCIEAVVPNYSEMPHQMFCDPDQSTQFFHTAAPGQLVGADPIMGSASSIACSVMRDYDGALVIEDAAGTGDGTDVNCIIPAQ
jgi:Excalibur calcium-binding domain